MINDLPLMVRLVGTIVPLLLFNSMYLFPSLILLLNVTLISSFEETFVEPFFGSLVITFRSGERNVHPDIKTIIPIIKIIIE